MFIGRDEEINALRGAIEARAPKIALVYGRRRIGKTALIRKAIGKQPALFIEGLENRPTQAQIAKARKVCKAFEDSPSGLVVVDNELIELPVVRAYYRMLAIAERIEAKQG